ncbi:K02A2.6-like [Cordylochernes scorpioides]|uniref:K02A2.6-like n=1 Tax=Cordylochernes scorpioides TaxID=51811 RepID=A0ABY6KE09_9ARAC|nr:K02A2.6-like [Cordylochernes scorpioides]
MTKRQNGTSTQKVRQQGNSAQRLGPGVDQALRLDPLCVPANLPGLLSHSPSQSSDHGCLATAVSPSESLVHKMAYLAEHVSLLSAFSPCPPPRILPRLRRPATISVHPGGLKGLMVADSNYLTRDQLKFSQSAKEVFSRVPRENSLAPHYKINEELSLEFGCLQWRERVVIPQKLRSLILNDLHEIHMGIVKMKMIARRNIEELTRECRVCQESASMPPATISEWTWPEKPWHRLHLDLAGPFIGSMFLVLVWTHTQIILEKFSPELDCPNILLQITEESLSPNGIRHTKTSPYNPSTNGLAERYVREFKNLLRKNNGKDDLETNLQRFLFAHRAFPQIAIKEFPRGTANEEKFKIKILEFNTKMGNPREVFHEAVRRPEQFTTGCEAYFRNYATGPKRYRHYLISCEGVVYKRHINQLRPVRKKQVETRNLLLPRTSGEKPVEVTSGNKEETASVHVPSCTPRPGSAAVHVPSCTPKPEPAAVQVPVRSPRPQRARKPPGRLEYY